MARKVGRHAQTTARQTSTIDQTHASVSVPKQALANLDQRPGDSTINVQPGSERARPRTFGTRYTETMHTLDVS